MLVSSTRHSRRSISLGRQVYSKRDKNPYGASWGLKPVEARSTLGLSTLWTGGADEEAGSEVAGGTTAPLATMEPRSRADASRTCELQPPRSRSHRRSARVGPVESAWRNAARVLERRLHLGLSRRWRSAARGPRFRSPADAQGQPADRRRGDYGTVVAAPEAHAKICAVN